MIKICNDISVARRIDIGLGQGTKLPHYYSYWFINVLPDIVSHCAIHMFSDYILLYIVGDDINPMLNLLNRDLDFIIK